MVFQFNYRVKFEYFFLIISILIGIFWSIYSLKSFDTIKINHDGRFYNQLTYHDLENNWREAENFRKKLKNGENFFEAIPSYGKYFLPVITLGSYYYIIDREILENNENYSVIKTKNFKLGFLLIQILFFYFSLSLFAKQIKKKVSDNLYKIIFIFLCLEPSLLQWHSSFWTESIFLSLMLILFSLILKNSRGILINLISGIVIGLMFSQRAVSFLYIVPVIFYFIIFFRKNFKAYFFLTVGFIFFISLIGYKNYKETKHFHVLSMPHQYYSYYHYFASSLYADRLNISAKEAQKILTNNEKLWLKKNVVDLNDFNDLEKNIKYRNQIFFEEVLKNPSYFVVKFMKRVIIMCIIDPFWVHKSYYIDKSDPKAKNDPKTYYHKDMFQKIIYSIFIYLFVIYGLFIFLIKIYKRKKIDEFDKFLIFNIFSIFYFIAISGLWGNPKYFAPCMLSISFFFAIGFKKIIFSYLKKNA